MLKRNPEVCGGGGIIRDNKGFSVAAFGAHLGINTINVAEALAMEIGIEWCVQNGHRNLELERLLINWILDESSPPWNIMDTILKIKRLLELWNK